MTQEKYLIPISILLSTLILTIGWVGINWINHNKKTETQITSKQDKSKNKIINIKKVDPKYDHIIGSKDADIFIVEYIDLECFGCKQWNNLEKDLIKKYKNNKQVAFVLRHFPLYKSIGKAEPKHPTSGIEARATECVRKLGGEDKFYKMVDKIFETTKSDGKYKVNNLTKLAEELGINEKDFSNCIDSEEIKNKIENDWKEAYNSGINATPAVYLQIKSIGKSFKIRPSKKMISNSIDAFLENN